MLRLLNKTSFVIVLELLIAALIVLGARLTDPSWLMLYHSYFADVALPFGFYFLLTLRGEAQFPLLRPWWGKALAVFALCAMSETLQYFGIYALAITFDPLDYLAYGLGVLLAALVERQVLARLFVFWDVAAKVRES